MLFNILCLVNFKKLQSRDASAKAMDSFHKGWPVYSFPKWVGDRRIPLTKGHWCG